MRKVEIRVADPCSKEWTSFEKQGLNGYCSSCKKVVIDFTKMSDAEIRNYFKKVTGDVCGRMRPNQQKVYFTASRTSLKPLASALMAGSAFLFSGISTFAQEKDQIEQIDKKDKYQTKDAQPKNKKRIVTGTVTDETGEGLPGVNVSIKGAKNKTQTDLDGNYIIQISSKDVLVFSFVGFDTQEIEIGDRKTIDISLGGVTELGGISYKWQPIKSLWWRTKNLFRRN